MRILTRILPYLWTLLATLAGAAGCSRMDTLTPAILQESEGKWRASQPDFYRLVIEMGGDRVEIGRFEVLVRSGTVVSVRRNGQAILPERGQDYSMDGLFRILKQELGLIEKPALLGSPPGYSAYAMARFDPETGRLVQYRRAVGGASNTIDIRVVEYQPQ